MVLGEVGDKVVEAIAVSTDRARGDFRDFRIWRPLWLPTMAQRTIAGLIHERIWAHLIQELEPLRRDGVRVVDQEPVREVTVTTDTARTYRFRFKRHSERDLIRSYPTPTDLRFWGEPAAVATFDGMEEVRLAAGYRWDSEAREIGATVVSYREGKSNPVWVAEIASQISGVRPIEWTNDRPGLPYIERTLSAGDGEVENESEAGAPS